MHACEELIVTGQCGHVLAAAMNYLKMTSKDDTPSPSVVSSDAWMPDDSEKRHPYKNSFCSC